MSIPVPPNEAERLQALKRYHILDTPTEIAFERIAILTARLFDVPIALVSFVNQYRDWFKAAHGLTIRQTDREASFGTHTILSDQPMVVPDALQDSRFADNPLVTGDPGVRFFAGAPLKIREGFNLGTLCIMDTAPREGLSDSQVATLSDLASVVVDELELRLTAAHIVEARAHLESLLQQIPAGVIIAEAPSGRLVLSNMQMEQIWRHSFLSSARIEQRRGFHPDGRPYQPEEWPLARSIHTGEVVTSEEIEILRGDGTRGRILANSAPIRNPEGRIISGVAIYHDVTEHKHLEDELRQAQKMEALGRLAGGVAHDFNNLLTIITGYTGMVADSLDSSDPRRDNLEEVLRTTNRAAAITRQLLAFGRREIIQPKLLDLNHLIISMDKMLRPMLREDIELVTVLNPDVGRINADPVQIEKIFLNLAANARDAMREGGRFIIETRNVELDAEEACHLDIRPGPYVLLVVSDTGEGMDAETQQHLFEPFFTTKKMGTGLGLSSVYGTVRQNGGGIRVSSELGRSTTIQIYLPRAKEAITPMPPPRHAAVVDLTKCAETILLVEDEAQLRKALRRILEGKGYTVLEAGDGQEGLRVYKKHDNAVDLLVTDVVMPLMSGRELVQNLRTLRPDLKVIYMSGYTNDAMVRDGILNPNTAFLQKPFTLEALAQKVREVLDRGFRSKWGTDSV